MTSSSWAWSACVSRAASPVIGDRRVEAQNVAALLRRTTGRSPGITAAPLRAASLANPAPAQAGMPKKVHEDAVVRRRVLVDQDADRLVRRERFEDRARAKSVFEIRTIAGERRRRSTKRVDQRIVERPYDHVHRRGEHGVREGAQLPVAEVRGGEQDAAAGAYGLVEVLLPSQRIHCGDVVAADRREAGESDQQPGDRAKHAVDDMGGVLAGQRDGEVVFGDAAQPGDCEVQQAGMRGQGDARRARVRTRAIS